MHQTTVNLNVLMSTTGRSSSDSLRGFLLVQPSLSHLQTLTGLWLVSAFKGFGISRHVSSSLLVSSSYSVCTISNPGCILSSITGTDPQFLQSYSKDTTHTQSKVNKSWSNYQISEGSDIFIACHHAFCLKLRIFPSACRESHVSVQLTCSCLPTGRSRPLYPRLF